MRFFGLRLLNDVKSVNVDYFIIGVYATPNPGTKYSFFFIAKKKERTLDKKEKQRRLKTVTKFNSKLVNSLPLRQHEFFIVSLSDCKLIVMFVSLIYYCEKSMNLK